MESNLYRKIGQQIKHARENLGMSQDELSKRIGYNSPATISHFESGFRKISLVDLQKVSDALGCSLDYLISSSTSNVKYAAVLSARIGCKPIGSWGCS